MKKDIETQLSNSKKLALIEMFVVFFYIVFVFNIEYGVFYLLYSPAFPLVFTIAFLIIGFKFDKKLNFWKGMSVLNFVLFLYLSSIFWYGDVFKNFH